MRLSPTHLRVPGKPNAYRPYGTTLSGIACRDRRPMRARTTEDLGFVTCRACRFGVARVLASIEAMAHTCLCPSDATHMLNWTAGDCRVIRDDTPVLGYVSTNPLFMSLTHAQVAQFEQYARANDPDLS